MKMKTEIKTDKWDISNFEMTDHQEHIDYMKDTGSGIYVWTGTLNTDKGSFNFSWTDEWTEDNGGDCGEITSLKPKDMSKKDWEELKEWMLEYIEEEYSKNRQEWRND